MVDFMVRSQQSRRVHTTRLPRTTKPLADRVAVNHPGSEITSDEWEFMLAIRRYQRQYRVRYPTWREVLYVLSRLGYVKVPPTS
jgi:hypothetical protein